VLRHPAPASGEVEGALVEREAERKAFNRAASYLNYNAAAKWFAYLAAIGTGVLYIGLLVLLWLFADLMVYRGQISFYRELSRVDQEKFQQYWQTLRPEERTANLRDLGLPEASATTLATASDFSSLPPDKQSLCWRSYVSEVLRQRVSGVAAAQVLPSFRELPADEQKAFLQHWKELPDRERLLDSELNFDRAQVQELTAEDFDVLPADRREVARELAWRVNQYLTLRDQRDRADAQAAADYLKPRLITADQPSALAGIENSTLADHGILGLVVRMHVRNSMLPPDAGFLAQANPYRVASTLLGDVAWWNPWMWKYGSPSRPNFFYYLTGLLVFAVLLALLRALLDFVERYMAAIATIEATGRLRRAVYHHTFRLGTLAVRALGPGEAVTIFTRHIEAIHDALYASLTSLFSEPIKVGLLLAFALIIHPLLAIAFVLFAVLIWLAGGQVAGYYRHKGRLATNRASEQLTLIRESLMLMRLVKTYLMELFNQSRVERQLARHAVAQLRRYTGEAIYKPLLGFLGVLATVVLLYVAGLIVLHGQLGVAGVITLSVALVSVYWPLQTWMEHRRFLRRGKEAAVVLFKFLDRPGEVGQVVGAEFLPPLSKELEFDNVTLKDPSTGRTLLQDVSLTIKAGQRVALVGSDDLEKHALVYLIPRFLDPTSGEIRIDQHNLRWVTLDSLRAQTALVLQHNLVFHDTVANNIGCGDPAYTLPQIIEAAKIAHAHHFIQKLPKGYETAIGELGHELSISEQFRIALARAILRDPALLIVEEPEAALDDDTKALLDDTFARVLPGRTAIFLPHRISTIRSCDRIFLVHKGRLEATGDHRGLLSNNPLYRHLHYLEFNEMVEQV
jgi:ATP-binding cassette subfamily B protein